MRDAKQLLGRGHLAGDMNGHRLQVRIDGSIVQLLQAREHHAQRLAGQIEAEVRVPAQRVHDLIHIRGLHLQLPTGIVRRTAATASSSLLDFPAAQTAFPVRWTLDAVQRLAVVRTVAVDTLTPVVAGHGARVIRLVRRTVRLLGRQVRRQGTRAPPSGAAIAGTAQGRAGGGGGYGGRRRAAVEGLVLAGAHLAGLLVCGHHVLAGRGGGRCGLRRLRRDAVVLRHIPPGRLGSAGRGGGRGRSWGWS